VKNMKRFRDEINAQFSRLLKTGGIRDCPVCDQGFLVDAIVVATDESIIFCEECDSLWVNGQSIEKARAMVFQTFVNAHGKIGLDWTELRLA